MSFIAQTQVNIRIVGLCLLRMGSLQAAQTSPQAEDESCVQGQSSGIINPVPVQNGICSGTWVSREGTGQCCQVSLTCCFLPSFSVFAVRGHNHDHPVNCIHCSPFLGLHGTGWMRNLACSLSGEKSYFWGFLSALTRCISQFSQSSWEQQQKCYLASDSRKIQFYV